MFTITSFCFEEKVGEERDWDVVFVDHEPFEARADSVDRLARRSRLVIMHDTEAPTSQMNFPQDFM